MKWKLVDRVWYYVNSDDLVVGEIVQIEEVCYVEYNNKSYKFLNLNSAKKYIESWNSGARL